MNIKSKSIDKKVTIVMPAYNAAKTLLSTYHDIPKDFVDEIILVDDASKDDTVSIAKDLGLTVIKHEKNLGYGGNQKSCYQKALENGADVVIMLHPDNQYNPSIIPNIAIPLALGQADIVLASRFIGDPLKGGPIAGGMPVYKYYLNILLTFIQNTLMGTCFSEFHTGYRGYTAETLRNIDFNKFSDDFIFDNELLMECCKQNLHFYQVPVETRYFDEASSIGLIKGAKYAWGCLSLGLKYCLSHRVRR